MNKTKNGVQLLLLGKQQTRGATTKCGSSYPQLEVSHRNMGIHIPKSKGHIQVWVSISPTQGATLKRGCPYPQLEGQHRSMGVHIPNSRGHIEAWESIF